MGARRDDSRIGGEEFRVRRLASRLELAMIEQHLGVQRAAVDKWQNGSRLVPPHAREMLETVESDIEAMVEQLVSEEPPFLFVEPPSHWPWDQATWQVVIARARYQLAERGIKAVIRPRVIEHDDMADDVAVILKKPNSQG